MATIIYSKSVAPRGNAKTRRQARRREAAIERDSLCEIIDAVFGAECKQAQNRVEKAVTTIEGKMKPARTEKVQPSAGQCLPNVAIYAAGHRKCENITCRGTQKFKGKSIPLI
jgi:hypothetical protein